MDGKKILIESTLSAYSEGRMNFTIAHETSHHILQMLYPQEYGVQYRRGTVHLYRKCGAARNGATDWNEWQADVLASVILLPAASVKAAMLKFGLGEKMKRLINFGTDSHYDSSISRGSYGGGNQASTSCGSILQSING